MMAIPKCPRIGEENAQEALCLMVKDQTFQKNAAFSNSMTMRPCQLVPSYSMFINVPHFFHFFSPFFLSNSTILFPPYPSFSSTMAAAIQRHAVAPVPPVPLLVAPPPRLPHTRRIGDCGAGMMYRKDI